MRRTTKESEKFSAPDELPIAANPNRPITSTFTYPPLFQNKLIFLAPPLLIALKKVSTDHQESSLTSVDQC
jgi:hypothetical protein